MNEIHKCEQIQKEKLDFDRKLKEKMLLGLSFVVITK